MRTLIRLLLEEQSDLGPHCLQNDFLHHKQMTNVVIGGLRVYSRYVVFVIIKRVVHLC